MQKALVLHHAATLGGGSTGFLDLLHMLQDTYSVVACAPGVPADVSQLVTSSGFDFLPATLPFPGYNYFNGGPTLLGRSFWQGLSRGAVYQRDWQRLIEQVNPDLVIVNSSVLTILGPAIRSAGSKAVCVVRETAPEARLGLRARVIPYALSRWFNGVVFISSFDREAAGSLRVPSTVVRDCVRAPAFRKMPRESACLQMGVSPATFNVLFTGGGSWFKGLDVALEAVRQCHHEDLRLVVAGYPPSVKLGALKLLAQSSISPKVAEFTRRISHLMSDDSVSQRTVFVGAQRDMSACYSLADVLTFPATLPHQSRPLIEAAHYGLPIVVSDYPQYAEHAPGAFTFPPNDAVSLSSQLTRIKGDRQFAAEVGARNRVFSTRTHDFATEQGKILDFLASI